MWGRYQVPIVFDMPGGPPRNFSCPECGAIYKIVCVPKPPDSEQWSKPLFCINCDHQLSPGDDEFVLKYVMISRAPHNGAPFGAYSNRQ